MPKGGVSMEILAHHGTEFGQTLRAELTAEGRDFREVAPARSIEEIAPHQLSWRIDVAVYRFHAQKIEDPENIPVHLVEIEEALQPDGVYYHSIVVDEHAYGCAACDFGVPPHAKSSQTR